MFQWMMGKWALLFLLLCGVVCGQTWQPYGETQGRWGNYRKGAGLTGWAPLGQDPTRLLFAQGTIGNYRDVWSGSIGFGYRQMVLPGLAAGVNMFGDLARSTAGVHYIQGSLGGELFGDYWVARINGYLTRHKVKGFFKRDSAVFTQGVALFSNDRDLLTLLQAYNGFDVEIGSGIAPGVGQIWAYGGFFRYIGTEMVPNVEGPRFRLEWFQDDIAALEGSRLTFAAEWEWNSRHGSTLAGYASIRFPLGARGNPICGVCRLMGDPVYRNRTIWVDTHDFLATPTVNLDQQLIFVQEQGGAGPGTQTMPTSLTDAISRATPGDVIFLLNNMGDIIQTATIPQQPNGQLYGFDSQGSVTIAVAGGRFIDVTDLTGTGRATLDVGNFASPAITMAQSSRIFGIGVSRDTSSQPAISSTANNISIARTNITMDGPASGPAIDLNTITNGRISTVSITNTRTVTTGDSLAITGSSNIDINNFSSSGNAANILNFDGVSGVTVNTLTTTLPSTDTDRDIRVVNAVGPVTIENATIASMARDAIVLTGNSGPIRIEGELTQTMGETTLMAATNSTTVDLSDLAMTASSFMASGLPAVEVRNSSGATTLGAVDLTGTASDQQAIRITMNTAPVVLEDVTVATVALPTNGGGAVAVINNSSSVTFNALDITGITGAMSHALVASAQTGLFTAQISNLTNSGGLSVLDFDTVLANVTIETLSSVGSSARGIELVSTTGSVSVADGTMTTPATEPFLLSGGSPDFSYFGTVTNTAGNLLTMSGVTGGTQTITGSSPGAISSSGGSIVVTGLASDLTMTNIALTTTGGSGITGTGTSGSFSLISSSADGPSGTAFTVTNVPTLLVRDVTVTNFDNGINATTATVDGDWTIEETAFSTLTTNAILLASTGSAAVTAVVDKVTVESGTVGTGVAMTKSGAGGSFSAAVAGSTFDNMGTAMTFTSAAGSSGSTVGLNLNANTIGGSSTVAQAFTSSINGSGHTVEALFANHETVSTSGTAAALTSDATTTTATIAFDDNTFATTADVTAISITGDTPGNTTINATLDTNSHTAPAATMPSYLITTVAGFTGTICGTLTDNASTQTTGIQTTVAGGTVQITDLANLSANNNGITVDTTGSVTRATACPRPTNIPLLP